MLPNRIRWLIVALGALLAASCNVTTEPESGPVVLAAASMQEAMEEVADTWAAQGHPRPALSFAGSSSLARQVESGAPADIFISADEPWMDELGARGLLRQGTRRTLLGNALVLIAPKESGTKVTLDDSTTLDAALGNGRLAMADPEAVPAGRYGKAALQSLGLWDAVAARVAPAENVRAALALVERGQAPLGIVYETDAIASNRVEVVARFPDDSHPPIHYPAAILAASTNPDTVGLMAFLASGDARRIFARHGFTAPR